MDETGASIVIRMAPIKYYDVELGECDRDLDTERDRSDGKKGGKAKKICLEKRKKNEEEKEED